MQVSFQILKKLQKSRYTSIWQTSWSRESPTSFCFIFQWKAPPVRGTSVLDSHLFDANPDSICHPDADPDSDVYFFECGIILVPNT